MDLRELYAYGAEDFTAYRMPENYELAGRRFTLTMDGGDRLDLVFPRKSAEDIRAGGGSEKYGCACFKISDSVFFAV